MNDQPQTPPRTLRLAGVDDVLDELIDAEFNRPGSKLRADICAAPPLIMDHAAPKATESHLRISGRRT